MKENLRNISMVLKTIGLWIVLVGVWKSSGLVIGLGCFLMLAAWYLLDFHYSKSK